MSLQIIRNDITKMRVDAIVNFEIKFCCFGNELFYHRNLSVEVVEGLLNEENTGL